MVAAKYVTHTKTKTSAPTIELGSSIELKKPDGTTLTIHDLARPDVQALVSTFMG